MTLPMTMGREMAAEVAGQPDESPERAMVAGMDPETARRGMIALYGGDFPLIKALDGGGVEDEDWTSWARGLWERHRAGSQKRVHFAARNRLFYQGQQWVSSVGHSMLGQWREPPKHRDAARRVANMVKPALDQRTQIVSDQRPGFRVEPQDRSPSSLKRATSLQLALEYQYRQQQMAAVIREARHWAGTDGVCVLRTYWDPDAGPWTEDLIPGEGDVGVLGESRRRPMGELRTKVYRIEQVRVSANASATSQPHYWVLRDVVATADAVAQYGAAAVLGRDKATDQASTLTGDGWTEHRGDIVSPDELLHDQSTLDRFTVDCEPSEFLPDGLTLVTVGEAVIYAGPLPMGVVPNVRFADGSPDPAFFPEPEMDDWLSHQMAVNAALSKWIESIRRNADGRFLGRAGAFSAETLIGGMASLIEVRGAQNLSDVLQPIPSFSVGGDTKELIQFEVQQFEQKSGWNDTTRGSFSSGESGRAILAQREQVEQIFAPSVNAAAHSMTEWAKVQKAGMGTYYDEPRRIAVVGKSRPDLGRELTREDFDGVADISIDPETLVPLPRAMRLYLLDSMLERQVITPEEYRRRLPFAWTRDIETPDDVQEARAQRICDLIRQGADPGPILWQDDEAVHQDVLDRELILADDVDPGAQQAAIERWVQLAQQAQMKMGGAPTQGGPMDAGGGAATPMPAGVQPMLGTNPGVAAAPLAMQFNQSDQGAAGAFADAINPG